MLTDRMSKWPHSRLYANYGGRVLTVVFMGGERARTVHDESDATVVVAAGALAALAACCNRDPNSYAQAGATAARAAWRHNTLDDLD